MATVATGMSLKPDVGFRQAADEIPKQGIAGSGIAFCKNMSNELFSITIWLVRLPIVV